MKIYAATLFIFLLTLVVYPQKPKDLTTAVERADKSAEVIKQFASLGADSLPVQLLKKAKAVAVFSGMTRVNILLNELTTGNGLAAFRTSDNGFAAPFFLALKAQDINLKMAGKKNFDVVLLFMDDPSIEWIKKGDISFTADGKRKIALGPVIEGKATKEKLESVNVLYYAMSSGQLIDTGLGNDSFFKAVAVFHDNNMSKAIFGMKNKQFFATPEANLKIPEKVENFRGALRKIIGTAAAENPKNMTEDR